MVIIGIIGLPGCGKTSIGRRLANRFVYKSVDVDDDILEKSWNCSVAEKLSQLGGLGFLEKENETLIKAVQDIEDNTVLSLSGSNPLVDGGMMKLKEKGCVFVYIDIDVDDVVERLQEMKVDRIVGQSDEKSHMRITLMERLPNYEKYVDLRILCGRRVSLQDITTMVVNDVEKLIVNSSIKRFTSTRSSDQLFSLSEVILNGLAPNQGLFMPLRGELPYFSKEQLKRMLPMTYKERAKIILERLILYNEISPQEISRIVEDAYSSFHKKEVVNLVELQDGTIMSELFHGPTGSFKDLPLQLLPRFIATLMPPGHRHVFLVATSGDTGSAVLEGFGRLKDTMSNKVAVVVFYPDKGISDAQRRQMVTNSSKNAAVVAVDGSFDDCQKLVKTLFRLKDVGEMFYKEFGVTFNTANSINWGRIIGQVVYHIHTYLEVIGAGMETAGSGTVRRIGDLVNVTVPSGNFGNILSGYLARTMGAGINDLLAAHNENNVLAEFFATGIYDVTNRKLIATSSPAIDILVASNLERFLWLLFGSDRITVLYDSLDKHRKFQLNPDELVRLTNSQLASDWSTEAVCNQEILRVYHSDGYLIDPHTAVGLSVARKRKVAMAPGVAAATTPVPSVTMATAHYSKFWPHLANVLEMPVDVCTVSDTITRPAPHREILNSLHEDICHTTKLPSDDIQAVTSFLKMFVANIFKK